MENKFQRTYEKDFHFEMINAPDWFEELEKEYPNGIECRDHELVGKIPVLPEGIIVLESYKNQKPEKFISKYNNTVKLVITSFIITCGEAIHYYGHLHSYGLFNCSSVSWGYPIFGGVNIELTRLIELIDVKHCDWLYNEDIGVEYTSKFWKIEDVIARGKEIFTKHFSDEWVLKIEDNT